MGHPEGLGEHRCLPAGDPLLAGRGGGGSPTPLGPAGRCCWWADTALAAQDTPRAGQAECPHGLGEARARCGSSVEAVWKHCEEGHSQSPVSVHGPGQVKWFEVQEQQVLSQYPLVCSHGTCVGLNALRLEPPPCRICSACLLYVLQPRSKDGEMAPELVFPAS